MCGIFGCTLKSGSAVTQILDGLKRLEYRGYDSIGVATIDNGVLQIRKDAGKIQDVVDRLRIGEMRGQIGIGHTRWATHGAPNMINAHPHTDSKGRIAVIHNGVIENFMDLKQELINNGHNFVSRTDTEVIPHLIEEEMKGDIGLTEATLKALRRLKGSYAIAVISSLEPDKIVCARLESPLVLAVAYGKPVVIVTYPGWTRAADNEETEIFASKLNAVLLEKINPENLESAVEEAKKKGPVNLQSGTDSACEAILRIAKGDKV